MSLGLYVETALTESEKPRSFLYPPCLRHQRKIDR